MTTALAAPQFRPITVEQAVDISEHVCPMRFETAQSTGPDGPRLLGQRVGAVSLVRYESCGMEHGVRTLEHIRANSLDYFILCVPLQARFQFSHAGLRSDFVHGAAVLLSSQRPFDAYVQGETTNGYHASLQIRVPGPMLRSRVPHIDLLCNQAFELASGAGKILLGSLHETLHEGGGLTEMQAQRQSQALADQIANCIEMIEIDRMSISAAPRSGASVFARAMEFIDSQLSDSLLDAQRIACHCHVSTSYLHKLFAQHALTVAGHVRELRLQRCREALRDPRLRKRNLIEIAGHWGFNDPSHFGRVYRKRFGRSPSCERSGIGRGDHS